MVFTHPQNAAQTNKPGTALSDLPTFVISTVMFKQYLYINIEILLRAQVLKFRYLILLRAQA